MLSGDKEVPPGTAGSRDTPLTRTAALVLAALCSWGVAMIVGLGKA